MIDNHVHVGWYSDGYHSPKKVWQAEQEAGIDEIVVSSTSTCAELYKPIVQEMKELVRLGGSMIHSVLWLTPRMFHTNCRWALPYLLYSGIKWDGIKLHWIAHREWYYNRKLLHNAMEVARQLEVPVLLHTGEFKECHASVFKEIIMQYDDLSFVLAHGRPLDETIDVLYSCPNTFVDTAFMPAEDVKALCDNDYSDRILFGTDAPINMLFYKDITTADYIKGCIAKLKETLTSQQFERIMQNKLYH